MLSVFFLRFLFVIGGKGDGFSRIARGAAPDKFNGVISRRTDLIADGGASLERSVLNERSAVNDHINAGSLFNVPVDLRACAGITGIVVGAVVFDDCCVLLAAAALAGVLYFDL